MLEIITTHSAWFWFILGGILLAVEMLTPLNGYLLWSGVAGILVGLFSLIIDSSLSTQGSIFAVMSVLIALIWHQYQRKQDKQSSDNGLNQRSAQLIGMQLVLDQDLVNGFGHTKIADSRWPVKASENLSQGCEVKVVAIDGITLLIEKL